MLIIGNDRTLLNSIFLNVSLLKRVKALEVNSAILSVSFALKFSIIIVSTGLISELRKWSIDLILAESKLSNDSIVIFLLLFKRSNALSIS